VTIVRGSNKPLDPTAEAAAGQRQRWADNRCRDDDDHEERILYHRDLGDVVIELQTAPGNNDSLAKSFQWGQAAAGR
jgi:hypothetical protein